MLLGYRLVKDGLTMNKALRPLLLGAFLASAAIAQDYPTGARDLTLPNTTGSGSSQLKVRVHYPATTNGWRTPLRPQAGGYPVLVFLHGLSITGLMYGDLGRHFASRGYVIAVDITARLNMDLQAKNGHALYPALVAENARKGAFFEGNLDMKRAGLFGHSMGGGNTIRILASNPGYAAGFCYAPWDGFSRDYPERFSAKVKKPLGIVHGAGDAIVPWKGVGLRFYQLAGNVTGLKFFYLFDKAGTHTNVSGVLLITKRDRAVWQRTATITTGFFDHHLGGPRDGLESVFGAGARGEPRLSQFIIDAETPAFWMTGTPAVGKTINLAVVGQPKAAGVLAAAKRGSFPTPFGRLDLDPATLTVIGSGTAAATQVFRQTLAIPADPGLIGAKIPFQGVGTTKAGLRLTNSFTLRIQR